MIKELLFSDNIDLYLEYYKRAEYKTVYQEVSYLSSEEKAEHYHTYLYLYEIGDDFVILPSIKRLINDKEEFKNVSELYYDLKTPHEFSGVVASKQDYSLINSFYKEFSSFCKKSNIIYSFIRFNPYTMEQNYAFNYNVLFSGEQVWVDCKKDVWESISKSRRREYNYALRQNYIFEEVVDESGLELFKTMYKDSMNALSASPFFYFNDKYFQALFNSNIATYYVVYDESREHALAGTVLLWDNFNKIVYYHLSCRNRAVSKKSSMEMLIISFIFEAKTKGYKKVHLSGAPTESLLNFKKRFSDDRVNYYIGYSIFNSSVYKMLCERFIELHPEESENEYKPLYRCKE